MEAYTKINLKRIAVAFGLILLIPISSCKKMEEERINTDTKKLEHGPYVAGSYITGMMQSIIKSNPEWWAQLQQNLNADVYSGFMASGTAFNGGTNNTTYFMMDGWNGFVASTPYDYVLNPWLDVRKETFETEKELYAISLIIKVSAAHRLTDAFGPIPYTQLGTGTAPAFDSQETIYNAFFKDLKDAVDILTTAEKKDEKIDQLKFAPYDVSTFGGDFKLWVQYANSLRLRLAMRISNVKSDVAKTEAEAAIAHEFGLLESTPFAVSCGTNYLGTVSGIWKDIQLNANMECYLNGYKDPRAAKYAKLATAPASIAGTIRGIRNGIDVLDKDYKGHSLLNFGQSDRVLLMTAAESFFLRAEAALNGWDTKGGSPQSFYEKGVSASFDQYGLGGVANYLTNTDKPTAYVDVVNAANSAQSPSTVTVKWDDALSKSEKLEKIITQKWIALFPEGMEAWSEFRRTTYPKLFPVLKNDSQGDIPAGQFIRRLTYPSFFTSSNGKGVAEAVSKYLGGPDKMSTPLWWDKN